MSSYTTLDDIKAALRGNYKCPCELHKGLRAKYMRLGRDHTDNGMVTPSPGQDRATYKEELDARQGWTCPCATCRRVWDMWNKAPRGHYNVAQRREDRLDDALIWFDRGYSPTKVAGLLGLRPESAYKFFREQGRPDLARRFNGEF